MRVQSDTKETKDVVRYEKCEKAALAEQKRAALESVAEKKQAAAAALAALKAQAAAVEEKKRLEAAAAEQVAILEARSSPGAGAEAADDAADDVCIWYNPKDSNRSIVVGTDKKWGLISYALNGSILSKSPFGKINNIDIYVQWLND